MVGNSEPPESEVRRISLENLKLKRDEFEKQFNKTYRRKKVYVDPDSINFQNEHLLYLTDEEDVEELPFKFIEEKKLETKFNLQSETFMEKNKQPPTYLRNTGVRSSSVGRVGYRLSKSSKKGRNLGLNSQKGQKLLSNSEMILLTHKTPNRTINGFLITNPKTNLTLVDETKIPFRGFMLEGPIVSKVLKEAVFF